MKNLSLVILSYNTKQITKQVLEKALSAKKACQKRYKNKIEIIVVDNGSTDGSREMIRDYKIKGKIRSKLLNYNAGCAVGYNIGMKKAIYDWILLLNNDTYLFVDTLREVTEWVIDNPFPHVAIGKLYDREMQPASFGGALPTPLKTLRWLGGIESLPFPMHRIYTKKPWTTLTPLEWIPTCFFLVHKQIIIETQGHDEQMFFYMEDVEWCQRIKEVGYQILFTPSIKAIHLGGESSQKKWEIKRVLQNQMNGFIYYHKKHYPHTLQFIRMALRIGMTLRGIYYSSQNEVDKADAYLNVSI